MFETMRFGKRSDPPCGDCDEEGYCTMNCGPAIKPSVPLSEQIAAVKREIALRERVYPRFIADGKMPAAKAGRELSAMRAVLETLEGVRALETECGVAVVGRP
jgi:hypothetical protein